MAQLTVGDVLEDRYRIDHPIARGGMSTVYRCVDLRLGRAVAAKVMDDRYIDDHVFRTRFRREARAMAQLTHPNLVNVYDFGSDGDHLFLIMELITGGTLRELLAERGPMPPHAAAAVMRAVLTGLSVAHQAGMVHRDIKPDNILVNGDHRVKLADFGLVRAASATNHSSDQIVGTVAYLSPEQVDGSEITPASDVYSAGVVLFELLTGATPFSGDTPLAHAYARLQEDMPSPSSHIAGVPPLFDALVGSATTRDPADRFSDAAEFLAALDDVAAEMALPAFTVPVPRNSAANRAAAVPTDTTDIVGPLEATGIIGPVAGPHETAVFDQPVAPEAPRPDETSVLEPGPTPAPVPAERPGSTVAVEEPDEAVDDEPKPVSNRSRVGLILWLLVIVALTAAVAVGGWWFGSGRYGEIPQVLGMERVEAVAAVEEAGFTTGTRIVYSDEVPPDQIAGTEPPIGERALRGEEITVLVSQGQPTVPEVPTGADVETFRTLAAERTLQTATGEQVYSDSVPPGVIAEVDPAPGESVPIGSTVTVQVSRGPQPIEVPDVVGMSRDEARRVLENAGLVVGSVTERFSDSAPANQVTDVNPTAGTTLERGSEVDLTVSNSATVPDVTGMDSDDAEQAIRDAGFAVDVERSNDVTGSSADTVVAVSPAPGTHVDPGEAADTEVVLTVPGKITVPDVTGLPLSEAEQRIEDAGLRFSQRGRGDGAVTEQDPWAGEVVDDRSRVRVQVED